MNQFLNMDEWTLDNGHLIVVKNALNQNQCKEKPILMFIPVFVLKFQFTKHES